MLGHIVHLAEALFLEFGVSDRKNFIDDQDLGFEVCSDRKRQPHVHSARIAFDRGVEEPLHFGEVDNFIELAPDFAAGHSQDGAVEKDVFTPAKLGVKSSADLKQAGHPPANGDAPFAWFGDARQDLEQRRFARTVASDHPDHVALIDGEIDIAQRPEFFDLFAIDDRFTAHHVHGGSAKLADVARNGVAQRAAAVGRFVPDQVFLAQPIGRDRDVRRHHTRSAKVFSVARNVLMPSQRNTRVTTNPMAKLVRSSCALPPSRHQRNPSIIPTIGLSA